MTITVAPSQDNIEVALWNFLVAVMATGMEIVKGQENRVPEPKPGDHIIFWPLRRPRLATNVDNYADVLFTGSIALAVMTVSLAQLSGSPGGIGTYTVSGSQTLSSRALSAGQQTKETSTESVFQVDVYGPKAADNAQIIATMLRDEYAVLKFAETGFATPLYSEDPRQMPFISGEQQYEDRWIVEVCLQTNPTVTVPQQFADAVDVDLIIVP